MNSVIRQTKRRVALWFLLIAAGLKLLFDFSYMLQALQILSNKDLVPMMWLIFKTI